MKELILGHLALNGSAYICSELSLGFQLDSHSSSRQLMAHLIALGGQVVGVMFVAWWDNRDLIHYLKVKSAVNKSIGLFGIVCQ